MQPAQPGASSSITPAAAPRLGEIEPPNLGAAPVSADYQRSLLGACRVGVPSDANVKRIAS
jgi:hypothetical protein